MRVVVQRSLEASCEVDGKIVGKISKGIVVLVGFTQRDSLATIEEMARKIVHLRIFEDENKVMNKDLLETSGEILSISQFTLYADTKKGNRPSYLKALKAEEATDLYQAFNQELAKYTNVATGVFGADMKIHLINDGPVTICMERGEEHV